MNTKLLIPYCLFQSLPFDAGEIRDAYGRDGVYDQNDNLVRKYDRRQFPQFDTMIALVNRANYPVELVFRFFHMTGELVLWSDERYEHTYRLNPRMSIATSLIPGNIFAATPFDFIGRGEVEIRQLSPIATEDPWIVASACLGGGGLYPDYWHGHSPRIPIFDERKLKAQQLWIFPYAIRYYDAHHSTFVFTMTDVRGINETPLPHLEGKRVWRNFGYETGIALTNYENTAASVIVSYTIGENYPNSGRVFRFQKTIESAGTLVFDLYKALAEVGYPRDLMTEGWVSVETNTPRKIVPYLVAHVEDCRGFSFGMEGM